ncbi:MAG TPA: glycosyl transferase [Actinobacteria bacterium]|nr:glycosyl transferase [Actinomycetota bacterium]
MGTLGAIALTLHSLINQRFLRSPQSDPGLCAKKVSVLIPARNEADTIGACLASVVAQRAVADLQIIVLDDRSSDDTAAIVQGVASDDQRVRLITGTEPAAGWLGKPNACQVLADHAQGDILIFIDSDVCLSEHAVAATVAALDSSGLDLVCPYPRQIAVTASERLIQPLLQWSWLTTLPLRVAERSPRESLVAANGQLLAITRPAYDRAGGHGAVRDQVLDDVELLRAVKRSGGRGIVIDGTSLAQCRMYSGWADLRQGYTKSLWSAFGSAGGASVAMGLLVLLYVVPPLGALLGCALDPMIAMVGTLGWAAAVVGRLATARRTGGRWWPDALAHPASIAVLIYLTVASFRGRRRGTLQWKGRAIG